MPQLLNVAETLQRKNKELTSADKQLPRGRFRASIFCLRPQASKAGHQSLENVAA